MIPNIIIIGVLVNFILLLIHTLLLEKENLTMEQDFKNYIKTHRLEEDKFLSSGNSIWTFYVMICFIPYSLVLVVIFVLLSPD